jgi:hypothetical protein
MIRFHTPALPGRDARPSAPGVGRPKRLLRLLSGLALFSFWVAAWPAGAAPAQTAAAGAGTAYEELLAVHAAFEAVRSPALRDGVADHSPAEVARRLETLRSLQRRHAAIDATGWDRSQQVDWLLVRSMLDGLEFRLRVSRPWARDPGFYVDRLMRITFAELPVSGAAREELQGRLADVPTLLDRARAQLDDPAADYVSLALHNLTTHDGVGHGHPYRAVPPPGVLGWYDDLLSRARAEQPELVPAVAQAREAVRGFHDWLVDHRDEWDAPAGVGRDLFDWYVRHVKLIPLESDVLLALGEREFERLTAYLALERHRNRALPPLEPAASADEYAARIADADAHVRRFIVENDILTIPDYVGELDTNVPWIVRPGGRNFWEEIQYRDPLPDHVHAVIPGHRFDWLVAQHNDHPIRSGYWSGARAEGWAVYLEEMMLNAGLLDDRPRTRELFHIFGIKRAVRVRADILMQQNRMSVAEATRYMVERVPYLDENVARVDAEIYLRRPPGYGLGYLVGMIQMEALLADRTRQLGEDFHLGNFHDEFLAAGRLPISLIRYEMTGFDEEIRDLWDRRPLLATH